MSQCWCKIELVESWNSLQQASKNLRVFICICPQHCEQNSCHNVMWRHFSYHLVFRPRLWLTFIGQKQKFAVHSRSNFFSNFGHLFSAFNPILYSHFKNIYFEIGPNLKFLRCFFSMELFSLRKNSFFLGKWLSIVNWLWEDYEKIVGRDEYPYYYLLHTSDLELQMALISVEFLFHFGQEHLDSTFHDGASCFL